MALPKGSTLALLALGLALWGSLLTFPAFTAATNWDHSWAQALAHFHVHNGQAGTDYIFTYGPLGAFVSRAYHPEMFWQRYAWELLVKLAATVILLRAVWPLPRRGLRLLGVVLLIFFLPFSTDALYYAVLLSAAWLMLEERCGSAFRAATTILLAVLSMTKFSYFVCAAGFVILGEVSCRAKGYRGLLSPLLLYPVAALAVWRLSGQRPSGLPVFLKTSWEISRGYGEAMALTGDRSDVVLALGILAVFALMLAIYCWRNRRRIDRLTSGLLLATGLFFAWKHGFTRHDVFHAHIFFITAVVVALLIVRLAELPWPFAARLAHAVALLGCVGGAVKATWEQGPLADYLSLPARRTLANCQAAAFPLRLKERLDADRTRLAEGWRLERLAALVGDESVDVLSVDQGVLLLNGLNWRPRPVFQSYSAYTPSLLKANADFFAADNAPRYLLLKLRPIDERLVSLEDSQTLLEILRRYYPVATEKSFLLLKRAPAETTLPAEEGQVVYEQTVRFNEEVNLAGVPGDYQLLTLEFTPTRLGALRSLFFHPEPLYIRLQTDSGHTLVRRLVPSMARCGFLLNPFLDGTPDLINLYSGATRPRIRSFTLLGGDDFVAEVNVTVTAIPSPLGQTLDSVEVRQLAYPMMQPAPFSCHSTRSVAADLIDGETVLMVPAEGELRFLVPPGASRVKASFGISPWAYRCDGVLFRITHVSEDGRQTVLFERYLDPIKHLGDRGLQTAMVELPAATGELVLQTTNPPDKAPSWWDWSFWGRVEIK